MKLEQLQKFFEEAKSDKIAFEGFCQDCRKQTTVDCDVTENGEIVVTGGSIYLVGFPKEIYLKCEKCFDMAKELRNFQPCETYSRVVGYYRPIKNYNDGKLAEFKDRKNFDVSEILKES